MMMMMRMMMMRTADQWFICSSIRVSLYHIIVLYRAASSCWSHLLVPPSSVYTDDRNIAIIRTIRSRWVLLFQRSSTILLMVSNVWTSERKNCVRTASRSIVGVRYACNDAYSPPPFLLVIIAPRRCKIARWNCSLFLAHICMPLLCDALFDLQCRVLPPRSPPLIVRSWDQYMNCVPPDRCYYWRRDQKQESIADMHSHRSGDGRMIGVVEERCT